MSREAFSRREFMTLGLAAVLATGRTGIPQAWGAEVRTARYAVDLGLLYDALTLHVDGSLEETVDPAAGRYAVRVAGQGDGIAHRIDAAGMLRGGRWAPERWHARFEVRGRTSWTEVAYDYERRVIAYRGRSETFLTRRVRVADDLVPLPVGLAVDDAVSATLNYAERRWLPGADGRLRTYVIRRQRDEDQRRGRHYGAELVPLVLRLVTDPASGRPTALVDLTRFSNWASADQPARVEFGSDRRPTRISTSLMLGTSLTIRMKAV